MGGLGSGRPGGFGRHTVESCRSIDINSLQRAGCLSPGWSGTLQWTQDGECTAQISLHMEPARLVLSYRFCSHKAEWEDIKEMVPIVRVPCRFGGNRSYFLCPGVINGNVCNRRTVKIYGPSRYFLCRHCYGLAYESQSESDWERGLRRANRIRRRLGGEASMEAPLPDRPKGMWARTYTRLRDEVFEAESKADASHALLAMRLLAKFEEPKKEREFWS